MDDQLKPEKGRILISAPHLTDIFKKTVIFLTEHNENGTVGFVINKPLKYKLNEIIDEFPEFDAKVFFGGPVETEMVNFIHKSGSVLNGGYEVRNGIFWGGNFESLKLLIESNKLYSDDFKFFVGYAGWGVHQLDDEIKINSWYVTEGKEEYLFTDEPEKLWHTILRDMGGEFSIISTFPDDPSMN
jgi:putative transcriptional regulator